MEFLTQTFCETTTQLSVNSNTLTMENLLNPDVTRQWVSASYADDSLTSTITVTFGSTQSVDRIAILETNAKEFNIFYNGVTANAFTITNPTTTTQFTGNTSENLYFICSTAACTSVTFDIKKTMVANSEKAVGYIYIGANELTFEKVPSANNYTPLKDPKEIIHEMSDGGSRRQVVASKWSTKIKLQYISQSFRDDLKAVYEAFSPRVFVPFGTGTGWDGILFEANWIGNFDFYKYSDNATVSGFSGSIELKQT